MLDVHVGATHIEVGAVVEKARGWRVVKVAEVVEWEVQPRHTLEGLA